VFLKFVRRGAFLAAIRGGVNVVELEACPAVCTIRDRDCPIVSGGELRDDVESETRAAVISGVAGIEDSVAIAPRDARAIVFNIESVRKTTDANRDARTGVFDSIPEQVLEDALELGSVSPHSRCRVDGERCIRGVDEVPARFDNGVEVNFLDVRDWSGVASEGQCVLEEGLHASVGAFDCVEVDDVAVFASEVEVARSDVERIAKVVADDADNVLKAFRLLFFLVEMFTSLTVMMTEQKSGTEAKRAEHRNCLPRISDGSPFGGLIDGEEDGDGDARKEAGAAPHEKWLKWCIRLLAVCDVVAECGYPDRDKEGKHRARKHGERSFCEFFEAVIQMDTARDESSTDEQPPDGLSVKLRHRMIAIYGSDPVRQVKRFEYVL